MNFKRDFYLYSRITFTTEGQEAFTEALENTTLYNNGHTHSKAVTVLKGDRLKKGECRRKAKT